MQTTPPPTYPDAQSTPDPDDSSDAPETASTTTSTTSWTRALQNIDLARLTPTSQAVKILIGDKIPEGYNLTEIANELGQSSSWVSERLTLLRHEILLQNDLFFPLTDHEYAALRQSIADDGIQVPVILGQYIPLIDGRHRLLIAQELGLDTAPAVLTQGLTPEQERRLAISLNAARRQLSRAQKRTIIETELMRDPARSDRTIAAIAGVHHETVGAVRNEIARLQQLEAPTAAETATPTEHAGTTGTPPAPPRPPVNPPHRIDNTGRAQPAPPLRPEPAPLPADDQQDKPIGHAECCHGQRHAIIRDGHGYRLETR